MCEQTGQGNNVCFDNKVYDCKEQKTTNICTYCVPNLLTGKTHCVGKQPVTLKAEAQAGVKSDELDHGEAGSDISLPVRRDAAVVAAHDTDGSTGEDATTDAFLARKREDDGDDAVSIRILCDRRTNSTDLICLGSTIHNCNTSSAIHDCGGKSLCHELKTEDMEFVHENKDPWCITEEERDFGLLTRRGQNGFTVAQKMGLQEECAGSNLGKENEEGREHHTMESICVEVDHDDSGGRERGGDRDGDDGDDGDDDDEDDDGAGKGRNATTSMVGAVYDCPTQSITSTCAPVRNTTLAIQMRTKGLCQQLYIPRRMAKCVDEKELESQYEALRQFVRVAEDGAGRRSG